eukprot:2989966-Rhodomonas_salina.1
MSVSLEQAGEWRLLSGSSAATGWDTDAMTAILLRLARSGGMVDLSRCAGVCRMWHDAARDESLWRAALEAHLGEGGKAVIEAVDEREAHLGAMRGGYRAMCISSMTTQVLTWGKGGQPSSSQPLTSPELLCGGLGAVGVRLISAGLRFSCAVRALLPLPPPSPSLSMADSALSTVLCNASGHAFDVDKKNKRPAQTLTVTRSLRCPGDVARRGVVLGRQLERTVRAPADHHPLRHRPDAP